MKLDVLHALRNPGTEYVFSVEQELPQVFKLTNAEERVYRCLYCETQAGK